MQPQAALNPRKLMKIAESALDKGRSQEAWDVLQQILRGNPAHVEALFKAGFMLHSTGKYQEAENYYRRAALADPTHIPSYRQILRIMESQNRGKEALEFGQSVVNRMPTNKEAHLEFIRQLMRFNHVHLVPDYADKVLQHFPEDGDLLMQKAFALKINGRHAEAERIYAALKQKHKLPLQFRLSFGLHLPRTYHSAEEIDAWRDSFSATIDEMLHEKPRYAIDTLLHQPVFQLAFHNRDNKELLKRYTQMLRVIDPSLNYVASHCKTYRKPEGRRLHIGFISCFMHKHSVGNCYRDTMIHLGNQPDMEVTLFNPANVMDEKIQEILNSKVKLITLPKMLEPARDVIAKHQLDLIFFPDIGMDATTHYLAMARLAPIQVCLNGHPETTGIDTIDYFFSPRFLEADNAQENYTETLLRFAGTDTMFKRPTPPARWMTREELNLPADKKLYVCPMAIQKFHPDFDKILADILAKDPAAHIVLFNDFQQQTASEIVRERILKICDPARVQFMPWLELDVLFSVFKTADALLDTIYFGGGTTILYAFGLGLPVVTMPTQHVRGRVTHAYYQLMQITDAPSADSPAHYADIAVKLANTPDYRANLEQQILTNGTRVFDLHPSTETYPQFVRDAINSNLDAYR